jgi:hypothetical protein
VRRLIAILSFVSALTVEPIIDSADAGASDKAADSVECKEIIARLIEATNASFDRYSPSGDNVFLKGPDIVLSCTTHRLTGVSLAWHASGFPPNAWFGLLAKAGKAVTGIDTKRLEAASRQCHRLALKDKDKTEMADLDIPKAKIECQAFTRDGGGASVSIWMNDHQARKGYRGTRTLKAAELYRDG